MSLHDNYNPTCHDTVPRLSPYHAEFYFEKHEYILSSIISQLLDGAGTWNPSSWKIRLCWFYIANRLVSQMRVTIAASREPAGKLWQLCKVLYVFEQNMQYLLIHAQFTRIVIFWHTGNVPPMIS